MLTGEFLRLSARRAPERTAVTDGDRRLSYRELDAEANRLAHALLHLGAGRDTRVAIMSSNRPEYAVVYFGAARAGVLLAHISTRCTAENLVYMLDLIDAEILFFEDRTASLVEQARARSPKLKHLISLDARNDGERSSQAPSVHDLVEPMATTPPGIDIHDTDPLGVTFTGGTTGLPKAVLVSHRARAATAFAAAVDFGLMESDIVAASTPLFHCAGLFVWFAPAIMLGTTVVTLPGWGVEDFMEVTEREGITAAFFVPSQLNDLVSHPEFSAKRLRSLKNVGYAGAPMGRSLLERVQAALPHVAFTENYGQSETCPLTVRCPGHGKDKLGTVGRPAFNVELDIVDAEGRSLSTGRIGEIVTRGEQLFDGYYRDPEQTNAAFPLRDGWLWTGDVGYLDDDGFLTLVDRSRDMLVSGGENVYPAEIENALYGHPSVAECAVFGIPHDHWGEVPAAHVVVAGGRIATEDELIDYCAGRIPRHKRPRLVRFVDALPRTAVGKIRKNVLREPYWRGSGWKDLTNGTTVWNAAANPYDSSRATRFSRPFGRKFHPAWRAMRVVRLRLQYPARGQGNFQRGKAS